MQRTRLVGRWFLIVFLITGFSFAQDDQVTRLGVTVLGSATGITGAAGRGRLVKALNKQKKVPLQALPIDAPAGEQISAEARQKNCAFVVFTTVTEAHNEGGAAGKTGQTTNIPVYYTTVEYKLYRLTDATAVASGSVTAHDIGSQGDIVEQALDRVATKVAADIKNAKTAPATK